jgi:uncharacterized membrane protein YesL
MRCILQLLKGAYNQLTRRPNSEFDMLRLTFVDAILIGWVLYGINLFISAENNCGQVESTQNLHLLMLFLLAIGIVAMLLYFYLLFAIPYRVLFDNSPIATLGYDFNEQEEERV